MPSEIRMVYVESGEHNMPGPNRQTVARYDLFGYRSVPAGGFDPDNDDHVADLGCWDCEAAPNCTFPDFAFEMYDWLQVLEETVRDASVVDTRMRRNSVLPFGDHDGPVTVVR